MSQIIINIADRFLAAFGYIPSGIPRRADIGSNIAESVKIAGMKYGIDRATRAMIQPYMKKYIIEVIDRDFANLTLKNGSKTYYFKNTFVTEDMSGVLSCAPTFSFTREKNIKTTAIDNSDMVVVESFGSKQWNIDIDGLLIDLENHWYPSNKLQQFREMFGVNDVFEVLDCKLLHDLGINSLYITDIGKLDFVEEYNDTIKYKLKAKSIKPVEFFM